LDALVHSRFLGTTSHVFGNGMVKPREKSRVKNRQSTVYLERLLTIAQKISLEYREKAFSNVSYRLK